MANDGQLVAALPGAVRLGGDQLGQRGQCSQSLAMPQRLDGGGEVVTQSGSALIATALGELSDLLNGRGQRGVVQSADQGRRAQYRLGVLRGRDVAGGRAGRHFQLGAGGSVPGGTCQPSGAGSQSRAACQQRCRLGGLGAGSERADDAVVSRGPDDRQAWKCFIGERHPPPPVWELRPAVIRRGMRRQHPQLTDTGLQGVRAFDMIDRAGQHDHLRHPLAAVGAVEVLAYPAAQVRRGADIEHLARRSAEQVHPRPVRQCFRQYPFAALRLGHVGQIRAQLGIGVHALVAHSLDECVQHVDGGASVVEGAVGGVAGDGEQPR
ncbi:Uncharacterised protein [Mycobacterium tuberculosis]|nr:Uncharacterised protein [Mycobacterium tuberculosis]CKP32896.1 Uncharacterised protein [Mycobacterium tuberculosis]CNU84848.1 Uncharacterised protein [Mycobacterium tuberculosis]CNV28990.1 Uncharacterised protein [Mycobacterium tuberculosis]CNV35514.1 Uncharacterised protein [Mycobacterium tuberculosis]